MVLSKKSWWNCAYAALLKVFAIFSTKANSKHKIYENIFILFSLFVAWRESASKDFEHKNCLILTFDTTRLPAFTKLHKHSSAKSFYIYYFCSFWRFYFKKDPTPVLFGCLIFNGS